MYLSAQDILETALGRDDSRVANVLMNRAVAYMEQVRAVQIRNKRESIVALLQGRIAHVARAPPPYLLYHTNGQTKRLPTLLSCVCWSLSLLRRMLARFLKFFGTFRLASRKHQHGRLTGCSRTYIHMSILLYRWTLSQLCVVATLADSDDVPSHLVELFRFDMYVSVSSIRWWKPMFLTAISRVRLG